MFKNQRAIYEQFGETIFCFEIAVMILPGQFLKFGVGAIGDGELLKRSDGKSCNESHSKEATSGSGRQAAWEGSMAG